MTADPLQPLIDALRSVWPQADTTSLATVADHLLRGQSATLGTSTASLTFSQGNRFDHATVTIGNIVGRDSITLTINFPQPINPQAAILHMNDLSRQNDLDRQDDLKHRMDLISEYKKRLRVLEIKAAKFGIHVPDFIEIEIQEIKDKIVENGGYIDDNTSEILKNDEIYQNTTKVAPQELQPVNEAVYISKKKPTISILKKILHKPWKVIRNPPRVPHLLGFVSGAIMVLCTLAPWTITSNIDSKYMSLKSVINSDNTLEFIIFVNSIFVYIRFILPYIINIRVHPIWRLLINIGLLGVLFLVSAILSPNGLSTLVEDNIELTVPLLLLLSSFAIIPFSIIYFFVKDSILDSIIIVSTIIVVSFAISIEYQLLSSQLQSKIAWGFYLFIPAALLSISCSIMLLRHKVQPKK
jgi:hypothetical protein